LHVTLVLKAHRKFLKKTLSIFHSNIRSLRKKLCYIIDVIEDFSDIIDVIEEFSDIIDVIEEFSDIFNVQKILQ
jgi:hypothetical protein